MDHTKFGTKDDSDDGDDSKINLLAPEFYI
jgi:hypothetical protein